MEKVVRQVNMGLNAQDAFDAFVDNLNDWWPKEYTWSKDSLKEIKIDAKIGGLCTEIGPYGFRCDWGRVTDFVHGKTISFTWQIGPDREPVPNPEKAGHVTVAFYMKGNARTAIELRHVDFDKHGRQGSEYCKMMGSDQGWKYILDRYKNYCLDRK